MDLRQLEYLVAIDDAGGFTAGAARVHVAQPSLSARIRDLERELGVDLFLRVGRGAQPTAAGTVVTAHARLVLRDVAAVRAAAASVAGLESGVLDLVALPLLAVDPVAGLVGRFRAAHPGITVRVQEVDDTGGGGGVAGSVRGGRAEIGIAELPAPASGLVEVPLADQDLIAIGLDLPPGPVGALAEIARAPLVLTPPGTSSRRLVDEALAALGIEPTVAVEVAQREAVVPLVLAGAGVGFVPQAQAEAAVAQGARAVRPRPALTRRIGLLHRGGMLSPAAAGFIAVAGAQPKRPVM